MTRLNNKPTHGPIDDQDKGQDQSQIAWHPAFVEAIQLELDAYRDSLEFYAEYQLTAEPFKIDCVVIKKAKEVTLTKNIASIFRDVNILEYKSPDDYVSVADFYKVYAYACLYASLEKTPITGLTISFVESRYPKRLLDHLRDIRGFTVEKTNPGIYTVQGDILPIQAIDTRQLALEENLWLKGLSSRLDPVTVLRISNAAILQGKDAGIKAYMNVLARANYRTIEEAMNMSSAARSLEEVLERTGFNARCEARAEARGEERKAFDIAQNMINLGLPIETVVSATKLDPEKIKKLYQ